MHHNADPVEEAAPFGPSEVRAAIEIIDRLGEIFGGAAEKKALRAEVVGLYPQALRMSSHDVSEADKKAFLKTIDDIDLRVFGVCHLAEQLETIIGRLREFGQTAEML